MKLTTIQNGLLGSVLKNRWAMTVGLSLVVLLHSSISFARTFNLGERVTSSLYGAGTVSNVDGELVEVDFEDYGIQPVDAASLSTKIPCAHDVCKDFQVDNDVYGAGTVTEVFDDGTSNVEFEDYGTTLVNTRSLAVTAKTGDQMDALRRAQLAEQVAQYNDQEE